MKLDRKAIHLLFNWIFMVAHVLSFIPLIFLMIISAKLRKLALIYDDIVLIIFQINQINYKCKKNDYVGNHKLVF